MLQPQVTLKSGGYLIINQTEALVAVDVNSGVRPANTPSMRQPCRRTWKPRKKWRASCACAISLA